jgi:hypothetical protein
MSARFWSAFDGIGGGGAAARSGARTGGGGGAFGGSLERCGLGIMGSVRVTRGGIGSGRGSGRLASGSAVTPANGSPR